MTRRWSLASLLLASACTGCGYLTWGTFPQASGNGVTELSRLDERKVEVRSSDAFAEVTIRDYAPSFTIIVLFVPLIPIPRFESDDFEVTAIFTGKNDRALVDVDSLRIRIGGSEHRPTSISLVGAGGVSEPAPHPPLRGEGWRILRYRFDDLERPREPFSIVIDGFPTIHYETFEREWDLRLEHF